MEPEIIFSVRNHIGHVTLNRPGVLNALSYPMIVSLAKQIRLWADDIHIHAVVIRGAGEKAFCAGGDIRALFESLNSGRPDHHRFFSDEYYFNQFIYQYPKPYIALLDGIVMGGGMGISQGASMRIVTDRTRMAMPEVGIGFFPDVGGSYFLSRCPGELGMYLGVTGTHIGAADAIYAGLADHYLPQSTIPRWDQLLDELDWTDDHQSDLKQTFVQAGASGIANPPLADLRPAIDDHFGKGSVISIVASLNAESRPAYEPWAQSTLAMMALRSPTMMCVTYEQLRRGKVMDLSSCFKMELGMVDESLRQGDFAEGVRALIVDKDMQPKWHPPTLDAVDPAVVARFFTAGDHGQERAPSLAALRNTRA